MPEPQPINPEKTAITAPENLPPAVAHEPQHWGAWVAQNRIGLTLIFGVLAFILIKWGLPGLINAMIVGLGLSFIIFIHELGHFAVAKWCDVHVETFSIGFGPPLPGCWFQRGETTYMLAMVPLGGYVKMVGENPENDEDDADPRSFKNKAVWQRMAIISAGVIMNLIFGCLAFITVYMIRGEENMRGIVGQVEAGAAAWVKDTQGGDLINQIGNEKDPNFGKLMIAVMLSAEGEPLNFDYTRYWYQEGNQPPRPERFDKTILPIRAEQEGRPMIGVHPSRVAMLIEADKSVKAPILPPGPTMAASRAEPPFEFSDLIVGSSADPRDPLKVVPLPTDPRPRSDGKQWPDYYEFQRRLVDFAGKEMIVQVQRTKPDGGTATVNIKVPPQWHYDVGLRMQMGQVAAIQEGSPAARAGVRPRDLETKAEGDRITEVEVKDVQGGKRRWVLTLPDKAAEGVELLDPMLLPFQLSDWAATFPKEARKELKVKLTLIRDNKHSNVEHATLEWNDAARYARPSSRGLVAPLAIPELGLAYHVETTVAGVEPDSPASRAKKPDGGTMALQPDDVILAYWYYKVEEGKPEPVMARVVELRQVSKFLWIWTLKDETVREAWPSILYNLQDQEVKKLGLRIDRGGETHEVVLDAREDTAWPRIERGLLFQADTTLTKAENIGQAMGMGFGRTKTFVLSTYVQLQRLASNRISFHQHATGPIGIFDKALDYASNWYTFLLFLGIISVNLAVINFLPVPVLDGGHMVFLIYEWIRGKPAPEWIRLATTYAGLVLILSLMLYVIYLDVSRLLAG